MPEDSPSIYTIMAERVANAILGKINALIGSHNTNEQAHQDIRNKIINESTYSVKTLYSLSGTSSSFDFSSVTDTHFQNFQTPIFVLARNTIGDNTANATIKVTNSGNTYPILDNTGGTISGYIGNGVWKKNSWGLFFIPPSAPSQLYNVFADIDEVYNSLYSYLGIKGVYTVNSINQSNSRKTVYTTDPLLNGNLIGNDEFIIIVNSYETNTDKNVYINHLQGSNPLRQSKNDLKESDVNGCLLRCAYSGNVFQVSNISTNTKLIPLFSDLSVVAQTGNYDHLINKPNIPSKTSDLTNDSDFITSSSIPSASSAVPLSDTTNGDVGSGTAWARSDHTHPKSSLYAEASHTHSQYLTSHQDITGKEDKSNKVTSLSSSSTDTEYPSAKAVYDSLPSVPNASSVIPSADTTSGSAGTGTAWARSDHTHPKSSLYAEATHTHEEYIQNQECYFDGNDFVIISDEPTITKTLTIQWGDNNDAKKLRPRYLQVPIGDITTYLSEESDWSVSIPVDNENDEWSMPSVIGYTGEIDQIDDTTTILYQTRIIVTDPDLEELE